MPEPTSAVGEAPVASRLLRAGSIGSERRSCSIRHFADQLLVWGVAFSEHRDLQRWAMGPMSFHELSRHWLHDVVDVYWDSVGMGPEAVVDLLGGDELASDSRCEAEKRPEFGCFVVGESSDAGHVAPRLHDQRPEAKRADAVLHQPVRRLVDAAARKRQRSVGEIARDAVPHDRILTHS